MNKNKYNTTDLLKNKSTPLVTIVLPAYNEEKTIDRCLRSIIKQTYKNVELIVIDDGSTDSTAEIVKHYSCKLINLNHGGPGSAKNYAARHSKGEILVFVDADMYLDKSYVEKLIKPIINEICVGTFSSAEYIANTDNFWSKCWNINNNLPFSIRIKKDPETYGKVYRSILKKSYFSMGGFDSSKGYMDDMTLTPDSIRAKEVTDAVSYHTNPDCIREVFISARWIGRSPKFSFNLSNVLRYSIFNSLKFSLSKIREGAPVGFIFFKIIFDFGVLTGIFFKNPKKNFSK